MLKLVGTYLKIEKMKYSIIVAFIVLLVFTSCGLFECENEVAGRYQFELPVRISPALDTFHIGDTIYIESIFSKEVFERQTQKNFPLEDFSFYPGTHIYKLDTSPYYYGALEFFDYIICKECDYNEGEFIEGGVNLSGQYTYDGEKYYLELLLIPQKVGLFMLRQGSGLYPAGSRQTFPGQCGKDNISAVMNVNNGADNNKDFVKESLDPAIIQIVLDPVNNRFADTGSYCFYVVE